MSTATITSMKGVCIHTFGGPDVLEFEEMARPEPAADEMLIRIHYAGVNPVDWKIREGYLGKFPLPAIMGKDFSGTVEALGSDVTDFHIGDDVFGEAAPGSGTYAEYTIAKSSQVARRPPALDHIRAAALPVAALTAWQALFDTAGLQAGQKVLIHAAAGGVGSLAVQFAKRKGARAIGTASAQHVDFVRELGADEIIDYRATRFDDVRARRGCCLRYDRRRHAGPILEGAAGEAESWSPSSSPRPKRRQRPRECGASSSVQNARGDQLAADCRSGRQR